MEREGKDRQGAKQQRQRASLKILEKVARRFVG